MFTSTIDNLAFVKPPQERLPLYQSPEHELWFLYRFPAFFSRVSFRRVYSGLRSNRIAIVSGCPAPLLLVLSSIVSSCSAPLLL